MYRYTHRSDRRGSKRSKDICKTGAVFQGSRQRTRARKEKNRMEEKRGTGASGGGL